ncbi:HVO_2072 family ArtA-dependent S-layer glycoprotein [Halorarius halobius]|uniref:HVO_2072 family ArtA-dependent S-layer glycoprotein n=1 Tax=Halorarius halobius TaxID=2962671 RepID=UPI0020CB6EE3|nr:HVO_2072 family ArtA-dependent S-layer glycoprotein [Halorarius halobius]
MITLNNEIRAILLASLMVLSVLAIPGAVSAAHTNRGGDAGQFNPGVGGPSDVVVSTDKPIVFRGEDGIDLVDENGTPVDPGNLVGVAGDAEGQPLEEPIPQDQALGQYTLNGQSTGAGVTVQQPRVTDLELLNERGADVADSSVPEDEVLLVRGEYNFETAEDLDINVFDENGNEITGDVLTTSDELSEQQLAELTGPYATNPQQVGNPAQRGTGTEIVYLQGLGQFNETQIGNESVDAGYWALDLSDQDAGTYTITVEGWDNLDFGPASRTATIQLTTDTDVTMDLERDEAVRGQYVPFTIRGSTAGATHFVAIEDDDFRNNVVDERVFRDVEDTVDRGTFDTDDDGTAEFAWAQVVIDEDTGLGLGQIDSAYLDDTNVDVNVFEEGLTLDDVAASIGDPEDDDSVRVIEGVLSIDEPAGSYIAGQEVDVRGTAQQGISDVALYARDQGDWELLDIDENGDLDEGDLIPVDADGEWEERDVRLSVATDIFAIPGRYRFGVIEAEDARGDDGQLRETLTTSEFSAGSSEQTSILVTEPGLGPGAAEGDVNAPIEAPQQIDVQRPQIFKSYNGQVATDDGTVDVLGTAPGQDDVLLVMVDTRGRVATEQVTVDDDDVFEEDDVPLITADGRPLNEGNIQAVVYAVGRDSVAGDGIIPGETSADIAAVENYVQRFSGTGLTQQQVLEIFNDETVDEAGSDDLFIRDSFRYTDGATSIETVKPVGAAGTGINPVAPGDEMLISGITNRKPDDNTIAIDVTEGPSANEFASPSTDEWNFTGRWSVTMQVPEDAEPGSYTLEADDGDNTDIVVFEVGNQTAEPAGPAATVSFANQTSDGSSVVVESASLPDGGFVVVHDASLLDGNVVGSAVGVSEYLEAGNASNVTVTFEEPVSESGTYIAMPHRDTNGNQSYDFVATNGSDDGPYTADGAAVTDDAVVTVGNETTATPEPGTPTPTQSGMPALALLVGLLTTAVVALYRRD